MAIKGKKNDGRGSDLTFKWMLTSLGTEWGQWQELAAEWMTTQHSAVRNKRLALTRFFETYLLECAPYATDISLFFKGNNGHYCSSEELEASVRKTVNDSMEISKSINYCCDFINFVIEQHLSEKDDHGN